MINYIIYSHTSYLDVLKIQTDYMRGRGHLTLFLDHNKLELNELYSKYDEVIFYDGNDQYAKRLLTCLEKIKSDYFLLIHDIDILLSINDDVINSFYDFLSF